MRTAARPGAKSVVTVQRSGSALAGWAYFGMARTPRITDYGEYKAVNRNSLHDQHKQKVGSLCIGDYVSLFSEDVPGFLCADGFTDEKVYVQVLHIHLIW